MSLLSKSFFFTLKVTLISYLHLHLLKHLNFAMDAGCVYLQSWSSAIPVVAAAALYWWMLTIIITAVAFCNIFKGVQNIISVELLTLASTVLMTGLSGTPKYPACMFRLQTHWQIPESNQISFHVWRRPDSEPCRVNLAQERVIVLIPGKLSPANLMFNFNFKYFVVAFYFHILPRHIISGWL